MTVNPTDDPALPAPFHTLKGLFWKLPKALCRLPRHTHGFLQLFTMELGTDSGRPAAEEGEGAVSSGIASRVVAEVSWCFLSDGRPINNHRPMQSR